MICDIAFSVPYFSIVITKTINIIEVLHFLYQFFQSWVWLGWRGRIGKGRGGRGHWEMEGQGKRAREVENFSYSSSIPFNFARATLINQILSMYDDWWMRIYYELCIYNIVLVCIIYICITFISSYIYEMRIHNCERLDYFLAMGTP